MATNFMSTFSWIFSVRIFVTILTYNCHSNIIFAPIESHVSQLLIGTKIIFLRELSTSLVVQNLGALNLCIFFFKNCAKMIFNIWLKSGHIFLSRGYGFCLFEHVIFVQFFLYRVAYFTVSGQNNNIHGQAASPWAAVRRLDYL